MRSKFDGQGKCSNKWQWFSLAFDSLFTMYSSLNATIKFIKSQSWTDFQRHPYMVPETRSLMFMATCI